VLVAARRRGDQVRIQVRDNGIGIAPVHQPRLFDEFFQVGNPERDARNGFGLGLAVVSRLAALLGTRVELRSRLHAGSCFWLDLPRASAARRAPGALLLDRDPLRRTAMAAMLASWGYAIEPVEDAARALAALDGTSSGHDALICTVEGADDPAWSAVARAADRRPLATRIVLCTRADRVLLDAASRLQAHAMLLPAAPAKLRALLATRNGSNTARDAA
jgi:CheY-like chemotaxis protein